MEQHHRKLINNNLEELMSVTNDLESIVDNLLKNDVINDWMKENILVKISRFNFIIINLFYFVNIYFCFTYIVKEFARLQKQKCKIVQYNSRTWT